MRSEESRKSDAVPLDFTKQIIVWLVAMILLLVFVIGIPSAAVSFAISNLAHMEKAGESVELLGPNFWLVVGSVIVAAVASAIVGGVLKAAADYSPVWWSVVALFLVLVIVATISVIIGEAHTDFGAPVRTIVNGKQESHPRSFLEGGWVVSWLVMLSVLVGWTLKAPWDRCAKHFQDSTKRLAGWMEK